MPSALIERWNVQKYAESFLVYGGEPTGRMINCNNATWDFLIGVNDSFSEKFMMGGVMGFSCDICAFPEKYKSRWKDIIEKHKADRAFYKNALARILIDSDAVTAIEYSDTELDKCIVQIFTKTVYADSLIIYPSVDSSACYRLNNELRSGTEINENGVLIKPLKDNSCLTVTLIKE